MKNKKSMEKKIDILTPWEEQISVFSKLNIQEAKNLYRAYNQALDEENKKELFNELIQGTLYVLVDFIRTYQLDKIKNYGYDIEDVINACNETWIETIKEGTLLEKKNFSLMLRSTFFTKLADKLNENDFFPAEITSFNESLFVSILHQYINFHRKNGEASFQEFITLVNDYLREIHTEYNESRGGLIRNTLALSDLDFLEQTYAIFEYIIFALKDENDEINITKTSIDKIKSLLIDTGVQGLRSVIDRVYVLDYTGDLIKKVTNSTLNKDLSSCYELDDRSREIIRYLYGLGEYEEKSVKEIADIYGISEARVHKIHNTVIERLANNEKILAYAPDDYKKSKEIISL